MTATVTAAGVQRQGAGSGRRKRGDDHGLEITGVAGRVIHRIGESEIGRREGVRAILEDRK